MSSTLNTRIITLGCAKNEVDSEEIAGVLRKAGYKVDGSSDHADVVIINTCGFLESSKKESIDTIRKAIRTKGKGKVIVSGCLAQRMGAELMQAAPGADAYIGVGQMGRFDEIINQTLSQKERLFDVTPPHHRWAEVATRARTGKHWSAYLKVSEGCDHPCTFCSIPSFRGKHDSKPIERVLEEAHHLVATGTKEINLIAQDVTQYGYDLYKKFTLPRLLKELNNVDGLEWIRILYFYPSRLTDEVIETMATLPKVIPYIDIPLQHAHPDVLRRMKRPGNGEKYLAMFEKLRRAMPDCAIRTTFIVGFPGETKEEFDYLIDFVKSARLDRVGAFMYSREPGTPSYDMPEQIKSKVKRERYEQVMSLQQKISWEKNQEWIGKQISVLIEEHHQGWMIGRSFRDAPEIDGMVFVQGQAELGSIVNVKVQKGEEYDLYGQMESTHSSNRKLTSLRVDNPKKPL